MPCTLRTFSEATAIGIEMLEERGAVECRRQNTAAIEFPCLDERGEIVGGTACLAPSGPSNGGRWDRSRSAAIFGMETISEGRARGEVVVTDNEIDVLTLHAHGVPAVAVVNALADAGWADTLTGAERIFVPVYGDRPVPAFVADMPEGERGRMSLIRLAHHRSVNALHADADSDWNSEWGRLVADALPWSDFDAAERSLKRTESRAECEQLVTSSDVLHDFGEALSASAFAGDVNAAKLLFLVVVSRLLARPISAAVKGPSSAGKSFLVKAVLRFLPDDAFHALTAMTDKALIYEREPLAHRVLVIQEAAGLGSIANLIVRSLLSEGRIDYKTVQCVEGELQTVQIVREGPTCLITTTTRVLLHRENETRVLSITVSDTPEQTREVLRAIANTENAAFDPGPWHAFQVFLAMGDNRVDVPYGGVLADVVETAAVRMRRDFSSVIGLVRAHALLHQEMRERDAAGRVTAIVEDYAVVRNLLEDILADGLEQTVTPEVRDVVEAVDRLYVPNDDGEGVTVHKLAKHLKLDRSTVTRRVAVALEREFLRDSAGGGRGRKKMLTPGELLPTGAGQILPTADTLEHLCTYACTTEDLTPVEQPSLLGEDETNSDGVADAADAPATSDADMPF